MQSRGKFSNNSSCSGLGTQSVIIPTSRGSTVHRDRRPWTILSTPLNIYRKQSLSTRNRWPHAKIQITPYYLNGLNIDFRSTSMVNEHRSSYPKFSMHEIDGTLETEVLFKRQNNSTTQLHYLSSYRKMCAAVH